MAVEYIDTREVPLHELTRFPGNAKRGDVGTIRSSIRRTGQYRSLVVRDNDGQLVILAGNHTFDAIGAEGHATARCELIHCTDDEARRINLADNRLAELGEMDNDALVELLSYLEGDYEGTGYSDAFVMALIDPPQFDDEGDNEGGSPAGIGNPVIGYQLVFDNEVQQSRWFEYLRWLKRTYPDCETTGERLHAHLGSMTLGNAG